jgi:hypothetical protein
LLFGYAKIIWKSVVMKEIECKLSYGISESAQRSGSPALTIRRAIVEQTVRDDAPGYKRFTPATSGSITDRSIVHEGNAKGDRVAIDLHPRADE